MHKWIIGLFRTSTIYIRDLKRLLLPTCLLVLAFQVSAQQNMNWTNRAGHVLTATPIEQSGNKIVFRRPNSTSTIQISLSTFPRSEQVRLYQALGKSTIPEGLQSAHAFANQTIKRSKLLLESKRITESVHQETVNQAIAALSAQAAPLIQEKKMTKQQLSKLIQSLDSVP